MTGWFETVDSEVRYEGLMARVRVDRVRMPDGSTGEREVVEQTDAVGLVPLWDDGTVVLLRQYRHPLGTYVLEVPAGKLDREDEAAEEAAHRELEEEVGLRAASLERLTSFYNSAGWTNEVTHLFLARGLVAAGPPENYTASAEEADMEVVRLALHEAVEQVRVGTIADAKTVIGLLLAAERT